MVEPTITRGKRKTAIARAYIKNGKGEYRVNSIPVKNIDNELARVKMLEPLYIAGEKIRDMDIAVNVQGGGTMGQAEATRTAVAKGIIEHLKDDELKGRFMEYDTALLVDDTRRKEPKHQLGKGARAKKQKSYR